MCVPPSVWLGSEFWKWINLPLQQSAKLWLRQNLQLRLRKVQKPLVNRVIPYQMMSWWKQSTKRALTSNQHDLVLKIKFLGSVVRPGTGSLLLRRVPPLSCNKEGCSKKRLFKRNQAIHYFGYKEGTSIQCFSEWIHFWTGHRNPFPESRPQGCIYIYMYVCMYIISCS